MAHTVMAFMVMAYVAMAYIVMAFIVMAYVAMAYILMAHTVMAFIVMAYVAMAKIVMADMVKKYLWPIQLRVRRHRHVAEVHGPQRRRPAGARPRTDVLRQSADTFLGTFSAHADGERRGLDRVGGQRQFFFDKSRL